MASVQDDKTELLTRIEILLEQDPAGQDDTLRELRKQLEILRTESNTNTIEKVFQLFGTAVGTNSKRDTQNITQLCWLMLA
jgi:hypothetical protein